MTAGAGPLWAGPYLAAALLLVAAGVAKVARPDATATALRRAGLAVPAWTVRAGAAAEVAAGCWALTPGRWGAAAVGASYLAFAGFVALALRRGSPVSSCGCFGKADSPATRSHLALNLAAAAVALLAAARGQGGLVALMAHQPLAGVPLIGISAAVAYLAYLVITELPRAAAAR